MARCPHCEGRGTLDTATKDEGSAESQQVHKDVSGLIKKEVLYSCPHCGVVLGCRSSSVDC